MLPRAVVFAGCVFLGQALAETLAPVGVRIAAGACVAAGLAARGLAPAWPVAALGLGFFRARAAAAQFRARSAQSTARYEGMFEVEVEEGTGWIVRAGDRRWAVVDAPASFPGPGRRARGLLRIDPIRARAEPSAFQAERWAAARGLHGRARVLGSVRDLGDAPGSAAALRRLGFRFRESARARLGFGRSAGGNLSTALLLGDRRGLDTSVKENFRRAGLSHVLALSGAHLAVLALGLSVLLRLARIPRVPAVLLVLAFVTVYTAVTGAAPPLVRACATVALATGATLAGRRADAVSSLAWATAGLLLVVPAWRHDIGFRLSVIATAILALYARRRRARVPGLAGVASDLTSSMHLSAIVTLATLPELGASFGVASLQGPVTNLLAALPSAGALGWGALAAFVPWPEPLATALAQAGEMAAEVLIAILRWTATWPGGDVRFPAFSAAAGAAILLLAARLAAGGGLARFEARVLLALGVLASLSAIPRERATFLDVGQGDAVLLEAAGRAVLIDAGPPGFEGRESAAAAAVRRRRLRPLEAVVVTHGHLDHLGGIQDLLARRAFRRLVTRGGDARPELLDALETSARASGECIVERPVSLALLGGYVHVRDPRADLAPEPVDDENDRSLATAFVARSFSAMLLGDGGPAPQSALAEAGFLRRAPVLMLPHHGSRHATNAALLSCVAPRLAIASCGEGNPHGHPHAETMALVAAARAAALRTDRDGTITLTGTPRGLRIRWTRDYPGTRGADRVRAFRLPDARLFP
jgi:competence protein ComEC